MKFEILNREKQYQGRAFAVQKVLMRLPNDKQRNYDLVDHNDSVTILPVDQQGNIWFVRQFRLGAEDQLLELPAGVLENGEDPLNCAARELREETGMGSEKLDFLGDFFLAPGYSNEHMYVYLATMLFPEALQADADEFLNVEKIPLGEVYEMAKKGQLKDAKTLATLLLAMPFLSIP